MVTNEFLNEIEIFIYQTGNTPLMQEIELLCLYRKCKNTKYVRTKMVWKHLVYPVLLYLVLT